MFWEPVVAISLSIFVTIFLFFILYTMSYGIVHCGVYVAKKIKLKISELRDRPDDDMPS